jgi:MFS family permease
MLWVSVTRLLPLRVFLADRLTLQAILAVPFVPFVADRLGRRRYVQIRCFIMCIGAALRASSLRTSHHDFIILNFVVLVSAETAAQNLGMFMAARGIVGLGITFAIVGASSLIGGQSMLSSHCLVRCLLTCDVIELAHPKERARLGSLFNAFFFTGMTELLAASRPPS